MKTVETLIDALVASGTHPEVRPILRLLLLAPTRGLRASWTSRRAQMEGVRRNITTSKSSVWHRYVAQNIPVPGPGGRGRERPHIYV